MSNSVNYFRIKVGKPLEMKKAKKLIYMSSANGISIYKTIMFDDKEDVFDYLKDLGCQPEKVSKLSLQNVS